MSNAIVMGANVLSFLPINPEQARVRHAASRAPVVDAEVMKNKLREEIREELRAEYEAQLACEVAVQQREMEGRQKREQERHRSEMETYQQEMERRQCEMDARLVAEHQNCEGLLSKCAQNFEVCITALRKEIQKKVVDLSISLAEIIVRHELPDRDMLRNLVVKTLEPVSDLQGVVVRISSGDWSLFGEKVADAECLGVGGTIKFAEDPNLSIGDVIVESRNGIFDARLDERLKLLKEMLHERSGRALPQSSEF